MRLGAKPMVTFNKCLEKLNVENFSIQTPLHEILSQHLSEITP